MARARRDFPRAVSVEGMGTAWGMVIRRISSLKIPEGSKAVNVREAKSRKNFINCVNLCLFAWEG